MKLPRKNQSSFGPQKKANGTRRHQSNRLKTAIASTLLLPSLAQALSPIPFDPTDNPFNRIELGVGIDVSGSIGEANFILQRDVYASVLSNPDILPTNNQVAIGVVAFDGDEIPVFTTALINEDNIDDLISAIENMTYTAGSTDIAKPIRFLADEMLLNDIESGRQIMDISTDGQGGDAIGAAQDAVAAGIDQINCLGIGAGANCDFPAGEGAFAITTTDFESLSNALREKLEREINEAIVEANTSFHLGNPLLTPEHNEIVSVLKDAREVETNDVDLLKQVASAANNMSLEDQIQFWESALPGFVANQSTLSMGILKNTLSNLNQIMQERRIAQSEAARYAFLNTPGHAYASLDNIDQASNALIDSPVGFFINSDFTQFDQSNRDDQPGFSSHSDQLTMGFDYRFSPKFFMGSALSLVQSDTDFDTVNGDQDNNAVVLSMLGNYNPSRSVYFDWLFSVGHMDFDTERFLTETNGQTLGTIESDTQGLQWGASVSMGQQNYLNEWQTDHYLRFSWARAEIDGYQESGNSLTYTVDDHHLTSLTTSVGAKLQRAYTWKHGLIHPALSIEATHEMKNQDKSVTANINGVSEGGALTVDLSQGKSTVLDLALSVDFIFPEQKSLFIRYEDRQNEQQVDQSSFIVGARMAF